MDCKGDVNSMHKLIYQDIRSQAIRRDLLAYMAKQAEIQAAHGLIGSKTAKRRNKLAWRKILSDVDDTLSCSGGMAVTAVCLCRFGRRLLVHCLFRFCSAGVYSGRVMQVTCCLCLGMIALSGFSDHTPSLRTPPYPLCAQVRGPLVWTCPTPRKRCTRGCWRSIGS